jgi:hypothetical protein
MRTMAITSPTAPYPISCFVIGLLVVLRLLESYPIQRATILIGLFNCMYTQGCCFQAFQVSNQKIAEPNPPKIMPRKVKRFRSGMMRR